MVLPREKESIFVVFLEKDLSCVLIMAEIVNPDDLVKDATYRLEGPGLSDTGVLVNAVKKEDVLWHLWGALTFDVNGSKVHITAFKAGKFYVEDEDPQVLSINDAHRVHIYEYDGYVPGIKGGKRTRHTKRKSQKKHRKRRTHRRR